MTRKFSRHYQTALLACLRQRSDASLRLAQGMGREALNSGSQTLDLARLHEHILVTEVLPGCAAGNLPALIKRAGAFFAAAITTLEKNHRSSREDTAQLRKTVEALSQRTVELASSNLELRLEIAQRKDAEVALKKSERHYSLLLKKSERLQEQLRRLSRQVLSAQEEERKEISRELHDVIAQTLTGINVRLAALKKEASINTKGLDRNIARTQRLVEKSVDIVHRFARELRPAALDDLGLIPALHSYMKNLGARTGLRAHLTAFAAVEGLDAAKRTVLYRVAQEALTNVARHAKASQVEVNLRQQNGDACMEIKDDGRSFDVDRRMRAGGSKRLGLLGMRERIEMVGGTFRIESAPGKGTTVRVEIPFGRPQKSVLKKSGHSTLICP